MLLDTAFWIDLSEERESRQRGHAHQFLAANRRESFAVSIITWGELAVGFDRSAGLQRLLGRTKILSLPQQVAWEASRIQREMRALGIQLGENDNWIAATARVWGFRLVTADRAFDRVPRLRVLHY